MSKNMQNRFAVIVGHSERKQGAFSPFLMESEWEYHSKVVKHLDNVDIYFRDPSMSVVSGINDVNKRINRKRYDLVLELHFNAYNKRSEGCEALYFHKNKWTAQVASNFIDLICGQYGNKKRSIKAISSRKQNGGPSLLGSKNDTIILEPFFGDNQEAIKFKDHKKYAQIINHFLSCI